MRRSFFQFLNFSILEFRSKTRPRNNENAVSVCSLRVPASPSLLLLYGQFDVSDIRCFVCSMFNTAYFLFHSNAFMLQYEYKKKNNSSSAKYQSISSFILQNYNSFSSSSSPKSNAFNSFTNSVTGLYFKPNFSATNFENPAASRPPGKSVPASSGFSNHLYLG